MENKYYTPSIEEFYVGFEFEISMQSHALSILDTTKNTVEQITPYEKSWEKTKVFFDTSYGLKDKLFRSIEQLKNILNNKNIRVKYLDKEDIESLGFKPHHTIKNYYKKDDIIILINEDLITIFIYDEYTIDKLVFIGKPKNKSELKRLLKQLNIK